MREAVSGVVSEAEDPQAVDDDGGRELTGDRRGGHPPAPIDFTAISATVT